VTTVKCEQEKGRKESRREEKRREIFWLGEYQYFKSIN
jgi:hypothetical protein